MVIDPEEFEKFLSAETGKLRNDSYFMYLCYRLAKKMERIDESAAIAIWEGILHQFPIEHPGESIESLTFAFIVCMQNDITNDNVDLDLRDITSFIDCALNCYWLSVTYENFNKFCQILKMEQWDLFYLLHIFNTYIQENCYMLLGYWDMKSNLSEWGSRGGHRKKKSEGIRAAIKHAYKDLEKRYPEILAEVPTKTSLAKAVWLLLTQELCRDMNRAKFDEYSIIYDPPKESGDEYGGTLYQFENLEEPQVKKKSITFGKRFIENVSEVLEETENTKKGQ